MDDFRNSGWTSWCTRPELQDIERLLDGSRAVVSFLGSGDCFGSGGRDQACIHLASGGGRMLLDCGSSALTSMRRFGLDPVSIDAILISHLHGDHFGGIPVIILDAQIVSRRKRPLVIAGPPGTQTRAEEAMEILYPGSTCMKRDFEIEYHELEAGIPSFITSFTVIPSLAEHESGSPSYAYRIHCDDAVVAYSGDSMWCEGLVHAAEGSELFICEASYFENEIKNHISYTTIMSHLAELGSRRIVLTHLGQEMLDRLDEVELETAHDGLQIVI